MKLHALALVSSAILAGATPLNVRQASKPSASVDTGPLTGTTTTFTSSTATVNQFLGIPFGAKPERFATPTAAPKWPGTYNATTYKAACYQQFNYPQYVRDFTVLVFNTTGPQASEDEDCLNLNVFAPSTASSSSLKPVMFWVYGGAFAFGANSLPIYDGSHFAADQDVVIVTINYRTNIFGFPGYPGQPTDEQNLGLLDQRLALDWVRRNIKAFGGDPDKITIFGESAGAQSVDALVTLPPSPVPFVAAIMQSGQATFAAPPPNNASKDSWNKLAENLTLTPQEAIPVVKAMPAKDLRDRIEQLMLTFTAVKGDGRTWSATPRQNRRTGNIAKVPVLIGSNANEGSFYTYGQSAVAQQNYTDYVFQCPAKYVAEETKAAGIATWRYYFDATFQNNQPAPGLGAYHSSEIPEVFGTYNQTGASQRQRDISKAMMKAWADFAKNPTQGPGWAQVPTVEVFDGRDSQPVQYEVDASDVDGERCAYWKPIYDLYFPV